MYDFNKRVEEIDFNALRNEGSFDYNGLGTNLDFNRKYSKEELSMMDSIDIYRLVLNGSHHKNFPPKFWNKPDSLKECRKITRFLFEVILGWDLEDICNNIKSSVFKNYKLLGMLHIVFSSSTFKVIDNAYPNALKPWQLKWSPTGFWNLHTAREATIWMIEEVLKWDREDVCNNLTANTFKDNCLGGMLSNLFGSSPFLALDNAYPNEYTELDLNRVGNNYWNLETGMGATKDLIENELQWTREDICSKLNRDVFLVHGLLGMLHSVFDGSVFNAIDSVYPGEIMEWELKASYVRSWDKNKCKNAVIWMIEEKLNWTREDICNSLKAQVFYEYGISAVLKFFNGSVFLALDNAYPGEYEKSDLASYRCNGRHKVDSSK